MNIVISYVTYHPNEGLTPKVSIFENEKNEYDVKFFDDQSNTLLFSGPLKSNNTIVAGRQWFTNWRIDIYKGGELVHTDRLDLKDKTVFIKIDSFGLGDNIAWLPYIEEFRKKHNCRIICSTFFNRLFFEQYPNILFVPPKITIHNVYALYWVGASNDNFCYAPSNANEIPLQKTACDILSLDYAEIIPRIPFPNLRKTKTVCISEKASDVLKEWGGSWQRIVDHLVSLGYTVKVISKEPTSLKNIIDKTGDLPLSDRIKDLVEADFFMGVSSGLSWLSWAVGTHVFLISDYTPKDHEFSSNCTRIYSDKCRTKVIKTPVENNITEDAVIYKINEYINAQV